jgi:stage II sporulation SpoAA-like protein
MTTIHQDPLFSFELETDSSILRFHWTDRTANMTDDDFKKALLLYANFAREHSARGLLVDVRNFLHRLAAETGRWRDEVVAPQYAAAGVKKFAYVVGQDFPMPPADSSPPPTARPFETRFFHSMQEAEKWLNEK